jgi:Sulfate permease family
MKRKSGWIRWLPGLVTLLSYQVTWLVHDIVAGVVLATMLVPVGIAYAIASGLPGIYGLYATIVPLLAYALFGPSRILVLGPDSSLAAVILGVVFPLSGGDPGRAVALAGMMAIVSGIVCILAGVARLGFVTELLSKPIRYGYMNGIALTVLISQLPKIFGFSIEDDGPLRELWAVGNLVLDGRRTGRRLRSARARWRSFCSSKTTRAFPEYLLLWLVRRRSLLCWTLRFAPTYRFLVPSRRVCLPSQFHGLATTISSRF